MTVHSTKARRKGENVCGNEMRKTLSVFRVDVCMYVWSSYNNMLHFWFVCCCCCWGFGGKAAAAKERRTGHELTLLCLTIHEKRGGYATFWSLRVTQTIVAPMKYLTDDQHNPPTLSWWLQMPAFLKASRHSGSFWIADLFVPSKIMSNLTTTQTTGTSNRLTTSCPQQKHQKPRVIWGFMLENTYFTEFDLPNHRIIEEAYQQRKTRQTSHYINIRDSHLPVQARVYFGVAQVHLRMPGTRYYVKRRIVPPSPPKHYQKQPQPNWSSSSSSSSSSSTPMVTSHQQQTPVWSSSSSSSTSVTTTTSDNMMAIPHHHYQATSPYLPTPSTSFAVNQQQQQQCGDFGFHDWMTAATPQSMMLDHMTMTKHAPWQQAPIVDTSSFEPHLNENDTLALNSSQFPWMSGDDFNTFGDMSFPSTPSVPF